MKPSSDLTAMYRSLTAYLWVEDEETSAYLKAVWSDPKIGIYVAGGCENVQVAVQAAQRDGFGHVFGFRDRDFGSSNRGRWADPHLWVLTSDAFELENLLLDGSALAACDVNDSGNAADAIEAQMHRLATPLAWWMACRHTMVDLSVAATADFPEHPTRTKVTNRTEAVDHIVKSAWWVGTLPSLPAWTQPEVEKVLAGHEASYSPMIGSGTWRREYSGKEILRDLVSFVWHKGRQGGLQDRLDFVRSIGLAQVALKCVPPEVTDLRLAIRGRVGLPP